MKILIVGINYHPELTGIGKYTGEMCEWLASRGHEVRVVTTPPYYPEWKIGNGYRAYWYTIEHMDDVCVYRCPLWIPKKVTGYTRILHLISFAFSSIPILVALRKWKPKVVINVAPAFFTAPAALLYAKYIGATSWLHIHDFELDVAIALGLVKLRALENFVKTIEKRIIRKFDKVSSISNSMVKKLKENEVNSQKIFLLPNWADTENIYSQCKLNSFRSKMLISNGKVLALYSGNIGKKQGLDTIVQCARNLAENKEIHFLLCGDGMDRPRIEKLCQGLPNVTMMSLQPVEKLNELLNAADIHLLPQSENADGLVMPSKLSGMLASGRPVIATVRGDSEVSIVIKKCGVTVPPGDSYALTEAILSLSRDKQRRAKLGQAARKTVMELFDKENLLSGMENSLYSFLSN